ncbi:uncharacterized protein LOC121738894 [Aricia agestis]|uniref:uncharacterized protein LOC121738894 n=1 Tax=Aricia agestis TaxID=91739 RepID=UPI001C206B4B|nr:uncharacterized protein LOC121738894 [Aricia agestis]
MPPKKGKKSKKDKNQKKKIQPPPKPKKIPPPPECFTQDDLNRFKDMFKQHVEEKTEVVLLENIPLMLKKLGFNPKNYEIQELFRLFLDEFAEFVEYHEWLQMLEAKMSWGDDYEAVVMRAFAFLGKDEEEKGICDFELIREELMKWGEPLEEIEFVDWLAVALRNKTYNVEDKTIQYEKFIQIMNKKDTKYIPEPINYFKLDQKTLAEMAKKKAEEEREEQVRKEAEKIAREEARRQKMIADGLIQPD